jgi:hypothetical protein
MVIYCGGHDAESCLSVYLKGEAMKRRFGIAVVGLLAVLAVCTLNYAQEGEEVGEAKRPNGEDAVWPADTWEDSIGEYEYVIASSLDEEQEKYIGKHVKLVDDFAVIWDKCTPHDSKEEKEETDAKGYKGDHNNQNIQKKYGYIKFETFYFRCLLPEEYTESVDYLNEVNEEKTYTDVTQVKPRRKLICIYGKLVRTTVWGKVSNEKGGADMGTQPEEVVLMVHQIERPAERFFRDDPIEEEQ